MKSFVFLTNNISLKDNLQRMAAAGTARTAVLITRLIGHTDVSTWNTIPKGRESERVGTHHHSDVLGQVPGAALKEI